MPYQPTSRVLQFCDALVTTIREAWGPTAPDEVARKYVARTPLSFKGRRVFVYPTRYSDEPATRGEVFATYPVTLWVAEAYPEAADMASDAVREWADERVDWVEAVLYAAIDFGSGDLPPLIVGGRKGVVLESCEVGVCDADLLDTKQLFWSELDCVFRELTD